MDPIVRFPGVSPATFLCLTPGLWEGGQTYLAENSSKSDRRSQMRRPVRAALEE